MLAVRGSYWTSRCWAPASALGYVGLGRRTRCAARPRSWALHPAAGLATEQEKAKTEQGRVESPQLVEKLAEKPDTCTGDELHYVETAGGKWKLALWRYRPACSAPARSHPLLLLSGVATNALGFDLDPSVSFARYMAEKGFDTWILEMRAAGLSIGKDKDGHSAASEITKHGEELDNLAADIGKLEYPQSEQNGGVAEDQSIGQLDDAAENPSESDQEKDISRSSSYSEEITKTASQLSTLLSELSERLKSVVSEGQSRVLSARLAEQLSSVLEDAQLSHRYQEIKDRLLKLLEERKSLAFTAQLNELSSRLTRMLEETQVSVSYVKNLQRRLSSTMEDLQKFLELIANFDWDFDHYVEEDVPAALDYIVNYCQPKDRRVLGVGHSMGGIVLYALLATRGKASGLGAVVTLASSLNYSESNSTLHMLLPLADPAEALSVPVVPLGAIMQAVYPLVARPPYALSWLGYNVSAKGMMDPDLYKKLVLNNFCTVPAKLILQLKTAFEPGGLKNRNGDVLYSELFKKCDIPVLAVAGDEDLICPPSAVQETVKALPDGLGRYKHFSGYGHYDLLVSRMAKTEVYPVILEFLEEQDAIS